MRLIRVDVLFIASNMDVIIKYSRTNSFVHLTKIQELIAFDYIALVAFVYIATTVSEYLVETY